MNSMKRQKGMTLKAGTPPVGRCPILLPEKSGEIIPERKDRAKAKTMTSCGYDW